METNTFSAQIQNVKSQSLSKLVGQQLENMILTGELKPGDRINESYLSSLLQISRAPIREACCHLAQYGMVENRTGKGTFVRSFNLKETLELYDIRASLDALAAEKCASLATDEEIELLNLIITRMKKCEIEENLSDYFLINLEFHSKIIKLSQNNSLFELYDIVLKKIALFRQQNLSTLHRVSNSLNQHIGIYESIRDRNPELASKLAKLHVENAKQVLIDTYHNKDKK